MNEKTKEHCRYTLLCFITGLFAMTVLAGCAQLKKWNEYDNPVIGIVKDLLPKTANERRKIIYGKLIDPDADVRRQGVLALEKDPKAAGEKTYEILSIMGQGDPDAQVRLACVRALFHLKAEQYLPGTLKFDSTDNDEMVRLEVATILGETQFEGNAELLTKMLEEDQSVEVRARCAESLQAFPSSRTVRALIEEVGIEEFHIAYRALESLKKITGQDLGYDHDAWEQWYIETDNPVKKDN